MRLIRRAEWGALPAKARQPLTPARVTTFFLHHAAGTYPNGPEAMRRIQKLHQVTNGWNDYAYSVGVWDDGTVYEGRGWGAVGGHTRNHNSTSVAVCYMGDGRRPVPKDALDAILWAAADADRHFGRPLVRRAHRDVGATQCPGDWLYDWWEKNKAPVTFQDAREQVVDPDGWGNRPSWVSKQAWQNLIDWRRSNK